MPGLGVYFKLKHSSICSKWFKTYAKVRNDISLDHVRFVYEGRTLDGALDVGGLGMKETVAGEDRVINKVVCVKRFRCAYCFAGVTDPGNHNSHTVEVMESWPLRDCDLVTDVIHDIHM